MRVGGYAVFEERAFRARIRRDKVHLIVPAQNPHPDGWEASSRYGYWLKTVPRLNVSRLFYVRTVAMLDGLSVGVVDMDEAAATVVVWADAFYSGPDPALHPDLSWVADNGSTLWAGTVAIDRLIDIDEPEYEVEVNSRYVPEPVWYPRQPG